MLVRFFWASGCVKVKFPCGRMYLFLNGGGGVPVFVGVRRFHAKYFLFSSGEIDQRGFVEKMIVFCCTVAVKATMRVTTK